MSVDLKKRIAELILKKEIMIFEQIKKKTNDTTCVLRMYAVLSLKMSTNENGNNQDHHQWCQAVMINNN